ncbi:formylglycine-generating enzyme family protein [Marinoscillum furvescens]|uniref:formylglycine-generating enzyme family protein n=1 Tax=Marinoscillum furvescens TaxID=1026 RepID=UPI000E269E51|nr:formylglycine-generating enzyme family protein [Marinoscillum furvescens]
MLKSTLFFLLAVLLLNACQPKKQSASSEKPTETQPTAEQVPTSQPEVSTEGMVLIPAGTYTMGGKSDQAYEDEFPRHEVKISAFYMDETEVTNAQFAAFVEATGYVTVAEKDIDWEELKNQLPEGTPKPADSVLQAGSLVFQGTDGPVNLQDYSQWWEWTIGADWRHPEGPESTIADRMDHPVVHIAWEDAIAYAKWAGKRLPTEAEWEWASMGGKTDSKYPWGNESVENASDKANFWQGKFPYQNYVLDGYETTAPVKSFPPNGYGLYDMAGNVWEWCLDKYDVRAYTEDAAEGTVVNPKGSAQYYDPREPYTPKHVIRGGSFLCNDSYCSGYRVSRRMSSSKDSGFNHTGFRCVVSK